VAVAAGGPVFVGVGGGEPVGVAVAVGVSATHWAVTPLQEALNTMTLPPKHCPPAGGPHEAAA
jgi:hypothetical protein